MNRQILNEHASAHHRVHPRANVKLTQPVCVLILKPHAVFDHPQQV